MSTARKLQTRNHLEIDNLHLLPQTNQLRALHTIIRDRGARREDFVFYSGRIIRLLIETGLGLLPFEPCEVETPVGRRYEGRRFASQLCGVSIARAGESMEAELRAVCRSVRIGKILIQRDKTTKLPRLYYSSLPRDIARCHVLLLDPMLATGGTALAAIQVLLDRGVAEANIIFVNLIAVLEGIAAVTKRYPDVKIVTSSIEEGLNENAYMMPGIGDFGDRYFGTEA
ncbi:uracil phosphoribosyltransferase [Sorangium sp. So ce295]|uniref:uracil phosphoribosyltransferase n=1 Tax=Sorangium sp. So ce295 TaxID=3133295 RepID=UPI003F6186B7